MTHTYLSRHARTGTATCPTCQCDHTGPVVADECGTFVEYDTVLCSEDGCRGRLCSGCPQFTCALCGLTFCASHARKALTVIGGEVVRIEVCGVCKEELAS